MVTPGRFSGVVFPDRFSFQRLSPTSQRASACMAEVFPELFGPMKTTGLPSSISTSPKRLKLRMVSLVSIGCYPSPYKRCIDRWCECAWQEGDKKDTGFLPSFATAPLDAIWLLV